jgi:hypothetical protein
MVGRREENATKVGSTKKNLKGKGTNGRYESLETPFEWYH